MSGAAGTAGTAGAVGAAGTAGASGDPASCFYLASTPVAMPKEFLSKVVTRDNAYHVVVRVVVHGDTYSSRSWYELFFERVNSAGTVLADASIYSTFEQESPSGLAKDVGTATVMALARTDEGFGVVWTENKQKRLFFALLDANGKMAGLPTLVSATAINAEMQSVPASLVWNGSQFAMLWGEDGAAAFAAIDRNGALLSRIDAASPAAPVSSVALFWDGNGYVALYEELLPMLDETSLIRLDPLGKPLIEPRALSVPEDVYTGLFWAGRASETYLAVLTVLNTATNSSGLVIREFDRDGTMLGSTRSVGTPVISAIAYNGQEFAALVSENNVTSFAVVGRDGRVGDQRTEIARSLVTKDGVRSPYLGRFDWHGGAFALYYAAAGSMPSNAFYVEFHCAE